MSLVSIKKTDDGTYWVIDGESNNYNQSKDIIEAIEQVLMRLEPENFEEGTITVRIEKRRINE